VIRSDRVYSFGVAPAVLWSAIENTGDFRTWWPWLRSFEGAGLVEGAVWRCVVQPPMPWSLRFTISLTEVEPGARAAAIVAGLAAADHMFELDAPLFDHARVLEGHPDNVAAALYGGFVVCGPDAPVRIDPAEGLEGVIALPPDAVATARARAALPPEVPLADATFNVAHASMLMLGLARSDFSLIARGLADRIHQPRRAALYPRSMELLERAESIGAVGASISGAGPAVLFWCQWQQTGDVLAALRSEAPDCEVQRVNFAPGGADVRALQ